jgi:hypothetical protein
MLEVLLKLEPCVTKYYIDHGDELEEDILTYQEWKKLYIIKEFL